jgi:rhamnopyranosyl-N-acetylglucosaminyl-diphospho-decaprenol beta-1,3/1,4-galactofuranosyltransferase
MYNVIAVVVTYNRLSLLKESIEALKNQTTPVYKIIVVNNGSTDGTTDWLNQQTGLTVVHQENIGGSGGFYTGIKEAYKNNADWIWVMDDDTICSPTALQKMLEKLPIVGADKVGVMCSKVTWKDGMPHSMNLPDVKLFANKKTPFTTYDQHNILVTEGCSFVSALVSAAAVRQVGLPYRDFYIWGDDQEYTKRITNAGFLGIYCAESIVLHKTPDNHRAYIYTDKPSNLWKHGYGFRNEFFMVRRDKGFFYYFLYVIARVAFGVFKIFKTRKTDRMKFSSVLIKSAWKSFSFNPKIDMV